MQKGVRSGIFGSKPGRKEDFLCCDAPFFKVLILPQEGYDFLPLFAAYCTCQFGFQTENTALLH
jgi:hypothetical protein